MSRKPQTCAECSRRKIKCDKVIPCQNCIKRGSAQSCRLADVTHTVERQTPQLSHSLSPSASDTVTASMGHAAESVNKRVLNLVTSLADRVKHLEANLNSPRLEKRPFPTEEEDSEEHNVPSAESARRQSKKARTSQGELPHSHTNTQNGEKFPGGDLNSEQPGFDAEVEDAATVLEFLAWGRLKDSNITIGLRDTGGINDSTLGVEKDIIQTAQSWGLSPSSIGGTQPIDTLQISQIQEMLPTKAQSVLLVEYHADWLLFMHCSFHIQTLRRELERFYLNDNGIISLTTSGLQWAALLSSVICGSMTCAKPAQIREWGFPEENQALLAQQWYQASVECLNAAKYQQNHCLYGVQAISCSTICAHLLGFSNSQSVFLASAVRIAQALGLHRIKKSQRSTPERGHDDPADRVQQELGKRVWQQLTTQDWFSVPFSETYCVNPLHFSTDPPLHCNEDTMMQVPLAQPTTTSYGNFLYRVACLMPALLDQSSKARTLEAKYEEVLRFDRMMRELVLSELPPCLNSHTSIDSQWPRWILLARRCLTVTSAHKIIMIHRNFLGMSFHDKKYAFTRRTCLAAAKTIINEVKQDLPEESPILWTMQAFSVAAAIILSLDNFSRHQSPREHTEHRVLIADAIESLHGSVSISSIAARGTRLLAELLAEDEKHTQSTQAKGDAHGDEQRSRRENHTFKTSDKSLNVAAFVKKFCESDQPQTGNSPIATSSMPLWLQQDTSFHPYSDALRESEHLYASGRERNHSATSARIPPSMYGTLDPATARRQHEIPPNTFAQTFSDSFDIRSVNWFDDLLGMAPSHSI